MSFLSILQNDLRTLSLEARKKFPQIKETTERAILKLRQVDDQEHDLAKKIEAVAKADDVLKPLLLACDSNNPKMVAIGVGALQKLIAQNAVSEASLPRIMRVLSLQVEAGDDTVKLKILQAVVSLLTTQTNMHGESLSQSLCMCFRLHKNKTVAVKNTASATLRQIVTMLFDRALLEFQQLDGEALDTIAQSPRGGEKSVVGDSNQRVPTNLPPSIKDAHFLLQDLCSLTGGDHPIWLPVQAISKTFGYELIEALLSTHQPLFIHIYEFQLLLKDRICPLVIKALGLKASSFTYSVRLLRLVGTFIKNFIDLMKSECEVFLERMIRIMSQETPIWMKALTMEVLKDICSNEKLLRSMYVNYDSKAVEGEPSDARLVFQGMVKSIARFVQKIFDLNNKLIMHAEPARTKCVDMLSHREPPATISLTYTLNLGLECLTAIIDAVASLAIQKVKVRPSPVLQYEPRRRVLQFDNPFEEGGVTKVEVVAPTAKTNEKEPNEEEEEEREEEEEEEEEEEGPTATAKQPSTEQNGKEKEEKEKKLSGKRISKLMAVSSWASILPALTLMLTKAGDEVIVESILRAYQLFIHICGANELIAPRDAFLTSLCHFAIPTSTVTITTEAEAAEDKEAEASAVKTAKIQVFEGGLMAKNVLALRTLLSLAHGMGGILGSAWPLVLQTFETLYSILHPISAPKSALSDAPPTLEKKGSATALPGIGGSGNGGLSSSSSGLKGSEETGARGIERMPSTHEFSSLSTSLESVFEGSKYLDDPSLAHFISALAELSSNALLAYEVKRPSTTPSDAPTPPSPMFGLSKLVDTTLQNVHRIDKIWPIISAHLIPVANHKVPSVRGFGVESLAKIMEASLTRLPSIPRRSFSVPSFSSKAQISQILYDMSSVVPTGTPADQSPAPSLPIRSHAPSSVPQSPATPGMTSPSSLRRRAGEKQVPTVPDMQIPFLELLDILAQSKYTDTRSKTMQALFAILQSSGQSLSTGWPVVLSIINRGNNDKQLIQVAFRCLGFICSDFLTNLPIECVEKVIIAIGKFGRQTAFMNISLTAVGLLWNIADFLATEQKALRKQLAEAVERREAEAELIMGSWLLDSKTSNKLWLSTYHELKQLCTDARTEVRNCAIQTLFKTLSTHGSLLEHDIWPSVIAEILFPLMNEIRQLSATAGKIRIDTELGKEGGRSVIMMVHHTRNTEEKQWNETQVLALQGIVQVFRTYFPALSGLPDFADSWHSLLELFQSAATSHSAEVSACAIQSLKELMHPHMADDKFGRVLWEDMWNTLQQIGDYLTLHHPRDLPYLDIPQQSLLELVRTVSHIHSKFRAACTTDDKQRLLGILEPLALYPGEEERRISPLQKKVLKVIEKLPPAAEEIYPIVFKLLLRYVTIAINYVPSSPSPSPSSSSPSSSSAPSTPQKASSPSLSSSASPSLPGKKFHPLAMKAIDLSVRFLETTSPKVVTNVFEELIMVLGAGMMIKYVSYPSPLWRTAVQAYTRAVTHALPTVARTPDLPEEQEKRIWTQLYAGLQEFLFHDRSLLPILTAEEMKEDEALDVGLADMLALHMLPCSAGVPFLHVRLIAILQEGSVFHSVPANQREIFAEGCYANLCRLCANAAKPDDGFSCHGRVSRLAYPLVMGRARAVLRRFVEDDRLAGARPLPRHQLAEMTGLLRQLRDLQLQPGLPLPECEEEEITLAPEGGRGWRPRQHLLRLYPQLCDCISTREDRMKPLLRELFHIAGKELGLE